MKRKAPRTFWFLIILFAGITIYELNGAIAGFHRYDYYNSLPLTYPFPALLAGNVIIGVGAAIVVLGLLLRQKWAVYAAQATITIYAMGEYVPLILFSEERYTIHQFIIMAVGWLLLIGFVVILCRSSRLRSHLGADPGTGTPPSVGSDHSADGGQDRPRDHAE